MLGLTGPCVSYDTACSAALSAAHGGQRALLGGECVTSVVSGVMVITAARIGSRFAKAGMTSPNGRCHTWDARADGYVRGEACGTVVLRSSLDGIRGTTHFVGTAVRQDGRSASLTAPSGVSQRELLVAALRDAAIAADDLGLHEAHGTGTALGDPIEAGSLVQRVERSLVIGGVKANIGHAEPAAGMTGLLKLAVGLDAVEGAPNAELRLANPYVLAAITRNLCALPCQQLARPVAEAKEGSVSSFGYSGTIANAVLSQLHHACRSSATARRLAYRQRAYPWFVSAVMPHSPRSIRDRLLQSRTAQRNLDAALATIVPVPACARLAVVGAGLAGIHVAASAVAIGLAPVVLEKSATAGGTWRHHGNAFSRVNSSEPAYRLLGRKADAGRPENTNHSYRSELLIDLLKLIDQAALRTIISTGAEVRAAVRARERWVLTGQQKGRDFALASPFAVLATNRRLGAPRKMRIHGEDGFAGFVCRGLSDDYTASCDGKRVMVLGMGAFAIENVRTSFEHGAVHVGLLCRRRGTVCPQICDWVNFIRPFDAEGKHDPVGDAVSLGYWQLAYDTSGATRPECWKQGLLKPDGHTVSTSDLYFLAHHLQVCFTRAPVTLGGRKHVTIANAPLPCAAMRISLSVCVCVCLSSLHPWPGCPNDAARPGPAQVAAVHLGAVLCLNERSLTTTDATTLPTDIVVKAVGFELNEGNERLLGRVQMRCNSHVDGSLWLQLEPHLDARFFNSPFGSSYLNEVRFNARVMLRHLQEPRLRCRVAQLPMPRMRINAFTASESHEGQDLLAEGDPRWREMLREHLKGVADEFNSSMSPEQYVAQNRWLWEQNYAMLAMLPGVDSERPYMEYPFAPLITEIPDLAYALSGEGLSYSAIGAPTGAPVAMMATVTAEEVLAMASEAIGAPSTELTLDTPLDDAGLDSLGATELRSNLSSRSGVKVSAKAIFEYPSARQLASHLAEQQASMPRPAAAAAAAAATAMATVTAEEVLAMASEAIGAPSTELTLDTPLDDAGLDSLGATELRSNLSSRSGVKLSAKALFEYPSARQLASYLAQQQASMPQPTAAAAAMPCTPVPSTGACTSTGLHSTLGDGAPASALLPSRPIADDGWASRTLAESMMVKLDGAAAVLRELTIRSLSDEAHIGSLLSWMAKQLFNEASSADSTPSHAEMAEIFFELVLSPSGIVPSASGPAPHAAAGSVLIFGFAGSSAEQLRPVRELYARARPQWRVVSVTAVKDPEARATQMRNAVGQLAASGPLVVHCMSNHGHRGYLSLLELQALAATQIKALVFDCGPAIDLKTDGQIKAVAHTAFSALLAHGIQITRAQQDCIRRMAAKVDWGEWSWQTTEDVAMQLSREPSVPTLCISGEQDDLCPPAAMREYAALLGAGAVTRRSVDVACMGGKHCSVLDSDGAAYEQRIVALLNAI